MLGYTRLTPEEKTERDIKLRIKRLTADLLTETALRQDSLTRSEVLRDELEILIREGV